MPKAKVFENQQEYMKHWRSQNAEKLAAYNKEYAQKNKEKIVARSSKRRQEKKEQIAEELAAWKSKNVNKIRVYNKEYTAKRYKNDPVFKLKMALRTRSRLALKGKSKCAKTELLLGCSYEHFKQHIESKFVDGMSWENMEKWHLDHIRPLSSFDLSIESEQQQAFHYLNMQPLWAIDNLKKGAKYG